MERVLVVRNGSGLTSLTHIIASSLVPHPRRNLIRGGDSMLHLILATLVIVIAANVIAGIVIASTLQLLQKGRGS
jgi:formate/nitrite transporter FocA (FNT family)